MPSTASQDQTSRRTSADEDLAFAGGQPPAATADSDVIRRLRAAGAVILGKTALCELAAYGHFTSSPAHGVTRNPWNRERAPGGSSGGSAAAERVLAVAASREPQRLRIAVSLKPAIPGIKPSPGAIAAVERTTELLQSLGHGVEAHELAHLQLLPTFSPRWAAGIRDDGLTHGESLAARTRQASFGRWLSARSEAQYRARARCGPAPQLRIR